MTDLKEQAFEQPKAGPEGVRPKAEYDQNK